MRQEAAEPSAAFFMQNRPSDPLRPISPYPVRAERSRGSGQSNATLIGQPPSILLEANGRNDIGASEIQPIGLPGLNQPALLDRRLDETCEQRMRIEGLALQLRVELHADEPGVVRALDDFRQCAVR